MTKKSNTRKGIQRQNNRQDENSNEGEYSDVYSEEESHDEQENDSEILHKQKMSESEEDEGGQKQSSKNSNSQLNSQLNSNEQEDILSNESQKKVGQQQDMNEKENGPEQKSLFCRKNDVPEQMIAEDTVDFKQYCQYVEKYKERRLIRYNDQDQFDIGVATLHQLVYYCYQEKFITKDMMLKIPYLKLKNLLIFIQKFNTKNLQESDFKDPMFTPFDHRRLTELLITNGKLHKYTTNGRVYAIPFQLSVYYSFIYRIHALEYQNLCDQLTLKYLLNWWKFIGPGCEQLMEKQKEEIEKQKEKKKQQPQNKSKSRKKKKPVGEKPEEEGKQKQKENDPQVAQVAQVGKNRQKKLFRSRLKNLPPGQQIEDFQSQQNDSNEINEDKKGKKKFQSIGSNLSSSLFNSELGMDSSFSFSIQKSENIAYDDHDDADHEDSQILSDFEDNIKNKNREKIVDQKKKPIRKQNKKFKNSKASSRNRPKIKQLNLEENYHNRQTRDNKTNKSKKQQNESVISSMISEQEKSNNSLYRKCKIKPQNNPIKRNLRNYPRKQYNLDIYNQESDSLEESQRNDDGINSSESIEMKNKKSTVNKKINSKAKR